MKRYLLYFVIVVISINICSANKIQNSFFSNPKIISSEEIEKQLDFRSLNMCWRIGENDFFRFVTDKSKIYFEIIFHKTPNSYEKEKDLFIEKTFKS